MYNGQSNKPTRYAVHCPVHGQVYLTEDERFRQLNSSDDCWSCPVTTDPDDFGLCGREKGRVR